MTSDEFALPTTGIPEFDRDHERLVLLIREVRRQLHAGRRAMAVACGRQAYALLQSHILREEAFLWSVQYPWIENHREAKARLREAATRFVTRLPLSHLSGRELLDEAEIFATQAASCMGLHDQRYAQFLKERGLSKAAE